MSNLERLRRLKGWTQQDLARFAGVPQQTISYQERGATRGPNRLNAAKLALALGCDPADLYDKAAQEVVVCH